MDCKYFCNSLVIYRNFRLIDHITCEFLDIIGNHILKEGFVFHSFKLNFSLGQLVNTVVIQLGDTFIIICVQLLYACANESNLVLLEVISSFFMTKPDDLNVLAPI